MELVFIVSGLQWQGESRENRISGLLFYIRVEAFEIKTNTLDWENYLTNIFPHMKGTTSSWSQQLYAIWWISATAISVQAASEKRLASHKNVVTTNLHYLLISRMIQYLIQLTGLLVSLKLYWSKGLRGDERDQISWMFSLVMEAKFLYRSM